jgi:hypothetical protein
MISLRRPGWSCEPLGDLAGAWNEVPESSYGVVHHGHDELHPFRPRSMPAAVG